MAVRVTPFPREAQRAVILRVAAMLALIAYGLIVDPDTGKNSIPCLWKTFLGFECPGCGLSRAGALLLHGRLREAAARNWIIFPFAIVLTRQFLVQLWLLTRGFRNDSFAGEESKMAELGAVELAQLTKDLTDAQKMIFQTQYSSERKDRGTAVILAIFLYDRLWLGDTAMGIVKIISVGL